MHEVIRGPRIDKRYLALACSQWPAKLKDVTLPLHKYLLPDGERRVQVQSDGKAALSFSHYATVCRFYFGQPS